MQEVSTQGHFGSSIISARGCYGQASSLAVDQESAQGLRLTHTAITEQESDVFVS